MKVIVVTKLWIYVFIQLLRIHLYAYMFLFWRYKKPDVSEVEQNTVILLDLFVKKSNEPQMPLIDSGMPILHANFHFISPLHV